VTDRITTTKKGVTHTPEGKYIHMKKEKKNKGLTLERRMIPLLGFLYILFFIYGYDYSY